MRFLVLVFLLLPVLSFPPGAAHWVRVGIDRACRATAYFVYS